jgi:hypothetical protein
LQFLFKNNGKTNANDFTYNIKVKSASGIWQPVGKENDTIKTVMHDSSMIVYAYPSLPIDFNFPDSLNFKIDVAIATHMMKGNCKAGTKFGRGPIFHFRLIDSIFNF